MGFSGLFFVGGGCAMGVCGCFVFFPRKLSALGNGQQELVVTEDDQRELTYCIKCICF